MTSLPFLRVLLIALLTGNYAFLLLAYLVDRRLTALCRTRGITKGTRFVAAAYVRREQDAAMTEGLKTRAADHPEYILWLKIWRFGSDVFLVLLLVFLGLALASMTNFRLPNPPFAEAAPQSALQIQGNAGAMSTVRGPLAQDAATLNWFLEPLSTGAVEALCRYRDDLLQNGL